jgi:hypothetical protein
MPVSIALRRLLQVRKLEEEQDKAALESALGDVRRVENALRAAQARDRAGRASIASGAPSADPADRIAGMVETEAARRSIQVLAQRASAATARAAALREEYLARRVERRQVDTVIREAEELEMVDRARTQQQNVDECFGVRRHARAAARLSGQISATARPASEKHEIKNRQESPAVPEGELRSNL